MTFRLEKVPPTEWNKLAEDAHLICFQERRPSSANTFDFALVCFDEKEIFSYATIVETDSETAYMQHGGAMPNIKSSIHVKRVYHETVSWLKERYKKITTRVKNTNVAMLKLAFSEGLLVQGVICYPEGVFLQLGWDLGS